MKFLGKNFKSIYEQLIYTKYMLYKNSDEYTFVSHMYIN